MSPFDPILFGNTHWVTKEGKTMRFADIDKEHLVNIYHMMRRKTDGTYLLAAKARVLGRKRNAKVLANLHAKHAARTYDIKRYLEWRVTTNRSNE